MTSTTPADDVDAFSDDDISACDDDDFVSDTIRRAGRNDAPEEKWVFQARSKRGSAVFNGLSSRVTTSQFKLLYNPVDGYLLDKAKKEVKHLLSCGRRKLHGADDGQVVTALDAFACALPSTFIRYLKEWTLTADDTTAASRISFKSTIELSRCVFGVSRRRSSYPLTSMLRLFKVMN